MQRRYCAGARTAASNQTTQPPPQLPGHRPTLQATPTTMLRTSVCLLAGVRLGAAQGSLSDDVVVLLDGWIYDHEALEAIGRKVFDL